MNHEIAMTNRSSCKSLDGVLVEELKQCCDEKGKEFPESVHKTAEIFNRWGLFYKEKSPDKVKLIQGVALLNAAIVRDPSNANFEDDLKDFCSDVLKTAGAKNTDADLVDIANEAMKPIKAMRDYAGEALRKLKHIPFDVTKKELKRLEKKKINDIQSIQENVTQQYSKIMKHISKMCVEALGEPPCKYALVGMGSLAKKEVTPFSDFEHIVLLEDGIQDSDCYEDALAYFRWYSTVFIIVLVNLKETILRFLTIPLLNDINVPHGDWFFDAFTPCGISPDGFQPAACKMPLGRTVKTSNKPWTTELIKPVSKMIKYLDTDEALKNGYHLFDILTKTCYVDGDPSVHDDFVQKRNQTLVLHQFNPYLLDSLADDLRSFDSSSMLQKLVVSDQVDIKRVVYRSTTLYISALGRLQAPECCSCFDIIASLHKQNVISSENAHRLFFAIAVACEIRLKTYVSEQGQNDFISQTQFDFVSNRTMTAEALIKLVGERSVTTYFIVAYNLQTTFKNKDVLANLDTYLGQTLSSKFVTLHNLYLYNTIILEWEDGTENYNSMPPSREMSLVRHAVACAYLICQRQEDALEMWKWIAQHEQDDGDLRGLSMVSIGKCLYEMNLFSDAMKHLNEIRPELERLNLQTVNKHIQLSMWAQTYALCKVSRDEYQDAAILFGEEYKYCDHPEFPLGEIRKAECFVNVAVCHLKLRSPWSALDRATKGLDLFKKSKASALLVANCHHVIGDCLARQGLHEKAIASFKTSLKLREDHIPPEMRNRDAKISLTLGLMRASEARQASMSSPRQ